MKSRLVALFGFFLLSLAIAEDDASSIGFASVSDAREALKSDPKASFSESDGWTIVATQEEKSYVLWSFTPTSHPAHPAAVKRVILEKDGAIHILMNAICEAEKVECDVLIEEFKQLNEQLRRRVTGGT